MTRAAPCRSLPLATIGWRSAPYLRRAALVRGAVTAGLLERDHDLHAVRRAAEAGERIERGGTFAVTAPAPDTGHPVEEKLHRRIEQAREFMELPAEMRFVPFLRSEPAGMSGRGFRHFGLALAGLKPSGAHAGADVLVDDVGFLGIDKSSRVS